MRASLPSAPREARLPPREKYPDGTKKNSERHKKTESAARKLRVEIKHSTPPQNPRRQFRNPKKILMRTHAHESQTENFTKLEVGQKLDPDAHRHLLLETINYEHRAT